MAEELEPVRQNIEINVTDKGADEATSDLTKLNTTITASTTATEKNTKEVKKSEDQFKSYKQQLKEATIAQQKLAQQYGATSTQAIDAAKKVATITDEMQFQKDLAKSYNPDEKFRALSQTAGLATLALGGVKDGLAALGIENKTLDKIIGSAQAILGVTSAVSGITDAYELLTAAKKAKTAAEVVEIGTTEALAVAEGEATVAVTAQGTASTFASVATNALNVAMGILLSPIVLIIAAVAALVLGIGYLTGAFGDFSGAVAMAEQANKNLSKSIDDQQKSFEKSNKQMELSQSLALGLAKAHGKSSAEIRKLEEALINQEVAEKRLNAVKQQSIFLEASRVAGLEDATDAQKETAKKAYEAFQKANQVFNDSLEARKKLAITHNIAVAQEETDARNKAITAQKIADEKEIQTLKDKNKKLLEEDIRAFDERLKKGQKDTEDQRIFTEKNAQDQSEQIAKEEEDKVAADQKKIDDNNAFFAYQADQAIKRDEEEKARDLDMSQFKEEIGNRSKDNAEKLLAFAASGAIKNKQIQKAAIITESGVNIGKTVSNTATAIGQDLKLGFPANIAPIALDVGVGASSIASILNGTKTALQAVGGGSAPSVSAGGVPAPSRNVAQVGFQGSSENQISTAIAKQQKDMPPLQAFVVSQSVTDQQELDRKKELDNSF